MSFLIKILVLIPRDCGAGRVLSLQTQFLFHVEAQHLSADRLIFRLLDDLLVRRCAEGSHDDVAFLRVDFGVESGVTDHVDDPLLSVFFRHVQLLRQHADRDALMDSAKRLEDKEPGVFDKVVETSDEEKVVDDDDFALAQLGLSGVKVEGDVQTLDEFRDGVLVCV